VELLSAKASDLERRRLAKRYKLVRLSHENEEAPSFYRKALEFDPNFLLLGRAYLFENDAEQALINLRVASLRNPADTETRVCMYVAGTLVAAGDHVKAKGEADEIRALQPGFSTRHWLETYPMTSTRQAERLSALLARVEL
jgi:tetratricopeptide (TPR) repeat protein